MRRALEGTLARAPSVSSPTHHGEFGEFGVSKTSELAEDHTQTDRCRESPHTERQENNTPPLAGEALLLRCVL